VKEELKPKAEPVASVEFNDHAVCDVCGRFGAVEIGDRRLLRGLLRRLRLLLRRIHNG
jgi:hypothetical protein